MITAPHKFYVGFRYAHPLTEEAIDSMEWYSFIHLLSLYCRLTFPSELVSDGAIFQIYHSMNNLHFDDVTMMIMMMMMSTLY